jgi:hypothetical protein
MNRRTLQLLCASALAGAPFAATAHLLDGSPDPLPRWVAIAGLVIAGVMGGAVGFAISKHGQSMEKQKKLRQQRAGSSPATNSPPPESAP